MKVFALTRAGVINVLRFKSQLKKVPLVGVFLIRVKWKLNYLRNIFYGLMGKYPVPRSWRDHKGEIPEGLTIPLVEDTKEFRAQRVNKLCKLSDESDFYDPRFKEIFFELVEKVGAIDRKPWEFIEGIKGLERLGFLNKDMTGLGIGAGIEKPIYYLAKYCKKIIATDLYSMNDPAWVHTANADMISNPSKYAPFSYPKDRLEMLDMAGQDLKFESDTFDFVFSFSSIEHFGRENILKTMAEIERVLKPGGVACITTEYIINETSNDEYFNAEDLKRYMLDSHKMRLIEEIDYSLSHQTASHTLKLTDKKTHPFELIFDSAGVIYLPLLLFFRKQK